MASGCTYLYDDNGLMQQQKIEVYLWPLFKVDPRIVCTYNYHGKYFIPEEYRISETLNKNHYCILYLDFPKYMKPVTYTLKSSDSYIEFLKLKHPCNKDNINQSEEIRALYGDSMGHLEQILNDLKDKDKYFKDIEGRKKEYLKKKEQEQNRKNSFSNDSYNETDKLTFKETKK